jgi:hypothetical protein
VLARSSADSTSGFSILISALVSCLTAAFFSDFLASYIIDGLFSCFFFVFDSYFLTAYFGSDLFFANSSLLNPSWSNLAIFFFSLSAYISWSEPVQPVGCYFSHDDDFSHVPHDPVVQDTAT